jgi:signal recognition particle subunit SRP19
MRKHNKLFLWPSYFDANKSRADGRRVPKELAISTPKLEELQIAAKRSGLQPETIFEAAHPNSPWLRSGLIVVPKKESKSSIVKKIAKELTGLRR